MPSLAFSSNGKSIGEDVNIFFRSGQTPQFNEVQLTNLKQAIVAAWKAMEVDKNATHANTRAITCSVSTTSCSIEIA